MAGLRDAAISSVIRPQAVCLMSDAALVGGGSRVGAVDYGEVAIRRHVSNFIESGMVSWDPQAIGQDWKHSTEGGPDRHFRAIRQIPIRHYRPGTSAARAA